MRRRKQKQFLASDEMFEARRNVRLGDWGSECGTVCWLYLDWLPGLSGETNDESMIGYRYGVDGCGRLSRYLGKMDVSSLSSVLMWCGVNG